jgi:hypothetical protein
MGSEVFLSLELPLQTKVLRQCAQAAGRLQGDRLGLVGHCRAGMLSLSFNCFAVSFAPLLLGLRVQ